MIQLLGGIIPFLYPLILTCKENSIFGGTVFDTIQLLVLVIIEGGPPAALKVMR